MRALALALVVSVIGGCGAPTEGGMPDAGRDAGTDAPDAPRTDVPAPRPDAPPVDAPPPPRCGDGRIDPGEACDDGNADRFDGCLPDCTEPPPIGPPDRVWTYYEIPGTQCIDGSPAGFGVSTVAGSTDLMIYLEGGGACFNDSCDFTALSVPFVPPPDGIFDRAIATNPVRDWNMIYVPYCTGDIHGGDADTTIAGAVRHFHGWTNFGRYLEAIVPAFPDVTRLLVTGISAGGFGAGLNAGRAADAFGPDVQAILVDDSGPPFGNEVIPPCLQQIFRETWGLDRTILAECGADCPDPNDFATGMLAHLDRTHPTARVGLFSNGGDAVIRAFMGFGWCDGRHDDCSGIPTSVPISVYSDGLLDLRARYLSRASFYFVGTLRPPGFGLGHTALRSPTFYTTIVDGVPLNDWLADVIEGRIVQVGP